MTIPLLSDVETWLTKRGFEVENAFSCREALAKLKGTKYDVVLTDLRLPDEDGIYLIDKTTVLTTVEASWTQ